jgi:hypothetical protein
MSCMNEFRVASVRQTSASEPAEAASSGCSQEEVELRRLTREIMSPGALEPFGVYVFDGAEVGAKLGRHVEQSVFLQAFGDTSEFLATQYRPYEQASFFICVVDHLRGLPVGSMRVLMTSPAGFKSLNDIEPVWGEPAGTLIERSGLALDLDRTWDVASLAVVPEYRAKATGGLVSMALFQALGLAARACGVNWFVAIFDMPVFRMIRLKLCMIFSGYEGITAKPYLGSPAGMPAWCEVAESEKRLAASDPRLHAILIAGIGLEEVVRPMDVSSLERLVRRQRRAVAGSGSSGGHEPDPPGSQRADDLREAIG